MFETLRTRLTIESNSLGQQNLIGYLIANLKPKLREERASQIHIPSWKLHFVSHLCSYVQLRFSIRYPIIFSLRRELDVSGDSPRASVFEDFFLYLPTLILPILKVRLVVRRGAGYNVLSGVENSMMKLLL